MIAVLALFEAKNKRVTIFTATPSFEMATNERKSDFWFELRGQWHRHHRLRRPEWTPLILCDQGLPRCECSRSRPALAAHRLWGWIGWTWSDLLFWGYGRIIAGKCVRHGHSYENIYGRRLFNFVDKNNIETVGCAKYKLQSFSSAIFNGYVRGQNPATDEFMMLRPNQKHRCSDHRNTCILRSRICRNSCFYRTSFLKIVCGFLIPRLKSSP